MGISDVEVRICETKEAVEFVRVHHSRLPKTQMAPWKFAFGAYVGGVMVAAALWNNPSARMLPSQWLELRRLACSPMAPHNTASKMMGYMTRYFKKNSQDSEKCISYHDVEVHTGTIYRASNWTPEYFSRPRKRDRSKNRKGTERKYRSDINSHGVASSGKVRWAFYLRNKPCEKYLSEQSARVLSEAISKNKTATR